MTFVDLAQRLADRGWRLDRAVPRSGTHALLQLTDPTGVGVAGQWLADVDQAERVARSTQDGAPAARVERPLPDVVVQAGGADRRLTALHRRCAEPGARLVAHRPERRGVVEHRDGAHRYTKVVRPGRVPDAAARSLHLPGVRTPQVLDADPAGGTVTTVALPGRTLHELLGDGGDDLPRRLREVGSTVRLLHSAPVPADAPGHGPDAEVAVLDRWLGVARTMGVQSLGDDVLASAYARVLRLLTEPVGTPALLHRDLHDKQLLLDVDEVGVLDLDLLAAGDPALDLANLVVHLELRARQGLITTTRACELAEALVAGYSPDSRTRAAATGYLLASRLRLVCVYAFRPASAAAAALLLTDPLVPDLG